MPMAIGSTAVLPPRVDVVGMLGRAMEEREEGLMDIPATSLRDHQGPQTRNEAAFVRPGVAWEVAEGLGHRFPQSGLTL